MAQPSALELVFSNQPDAFPTSRAHGFCSQKSDADLEGGQTRLAVGLVAYIEPGLYAGGAEVRPPLFHTLRCQHWLPGRYCRCSRLACLAEDAWYIRCLRASCSPGRHPAAGRAHGAVMAPDGLAPLTVASVACAAQSRAGSEVEC